MTLSGTVDSQVVTISGTGEYDGENLESTTAEIAVDGAGDAVVRVSSQLDVTIRGVGSVEYIGNPEVDQNIRGPVRSSDADDGRGRSGAAQQRLERRRVGERVGRSRRCPLCDEVGELACGAVDALDEARPGGLSATPSPPTRRTPPGATTARR